MNKQEIDIDFVRHLRLQFGNIHWEFENENNENLVPENLTHNFLLKHNQVDENIILYYHKATARFISDSEYKEKVEGGFNEKKELSLSPYPYNILGAYYARIDLHIKLLSSIYDRERGNLTLEGKSNLRYLIDFMPYFRQYAEGFKIGFDNFEKDLITPNLPMFPNKEDFINKVHDFLTLNRLFTRSWINNHSSFRMTMNSKYDEFKIIEGFEDGKKQGYFYRAWSYVFGNSKLFEPLFNETMLTTKSDEKLKTTPYPFVKTGYYKGFLSYVSKYIIEPYVDYSYLFQRMKIENMIYDIKHFDFMKWLLQNDCISEKNYDVFISKESFRSLDKSTSTNRENNFNLVFNIQ